MALPRLHAPRWGAPSVDTGSLRVTLDDMIRAHRATAAFLWEQRSALNPSPALAASPLLMDTASAAAEGARVEPPPRSAAPAAAPPLAREKNCAHWGGEPAPRYVRRAVAPPRARVLSFLQQRRDATATVRTLMRRLHFKTAEIIAILDELQRAGLGRLHVHRWRPLFAHRHYEALVFTLTARGRDPAVLLF